MKSFILPLFLILLSGSAFSQKEISVYDLTCEHKKNPIGIDVLQPRLSWKLKSAGFNVLQTAYSLKVSSDQKMAGTKTSWATGKISSDESVLIPYAGPVLNAGQRYYWQVKVWDNKGRESKWSEPAFFETGLISPSEWKAKWIELEADTNRYYPSPHFRKEFNISKPIKSARIYVTSHGFYELQLNGRKVGDQIFTPGWTSYSYRLQYQVYDVTDQLVRGGNVVGAILGDGWFRGTLAWGNNWSVYGKRLGLLMQMKVKYADGTEEMILTDGTWRGCIDGAIVMNDIYDGETYDASRKLTGWSLPGYNDTKWSSVRTGSYSLNNIIASEGDPVRKIQEIKPVRIFKTIKGSLVADMGQNMVGWLRIKVKGPKGTVVTIRHAEVLDKYGEFYTENYRAAKTRLTYILSGDGEEIYEPRFTFMGFRYAEVTGFPGELTLDNLTGVVVHSDMTPTGSYESSNQLLNQLQHNIQWGQKGNFVDVPTDCPQRDERLGWTGDAQAFCRTAAFNYNVSSFFTKWLKDVAADQRKGGEVPVVVPDVLEKQGSETASASAGWGDVAVIAPWTMYTVYGDRRLLETQYPSMKAWVDYIRKRAGDDMIWRGGSTYGDWLFYHPPVNNHPEPDGHTEHDFIATAYFAYSANLLAKAAKELGKTEDEKFYTDIFNRIKTVFNREYVTPAGRIGTNSQTSYILPLMFGLLPVDMRQKAAGFLVNDIKSRKNHLSCGFLGTIYLCHVLTENGFTDVAYDLLLQENYPSWLYPVRMGATTIWERWDGQKPDSTFQDPGMNSFNHYAYGAIGDWMYRVSAGIETTSPGYRHLLIQPHPTTQLAYSKASFESQYGTVASGWERKDGKIVVRVQIPVNSSATILLPAKSASQVTENGKSLVENKNLSGITGSGSSIKLEAGSGNYTFEITE